MGKLIILQKDGFPHSLHYAKMGNWMEQPAVNIELEYVIQESRDWIQVEELTMASSFSSPFRFQYFLQ